MEKANVSRIRLALIAGLLTFVVSASSMGTVRADGTILRGFDVPALVPQSPTGSSVSPAIYWPIGVAFDGKNLWYSQPCDCTSDIFQTTTRGTLLGTLREVNQAGALAWDGSHLWVAVASRLATTCTVGVAGCAFMTEVDVTTGNPIKVVDISAIFAPDQECNFIDGLDFDSSATFWVSPDIGCAFAFTNNPCSIGFVYNVDTSGNLLKRVQLPFGVAGVAKVGSFLYMVTCGTSTSGGRLVHKTTLDGTVVSTFVATTITGNRESAEDLAFDPVTFAPNCALWIVKDYGFPFDGALGAYQIDCP